MNKIYNVVWSKAKGCYIVASEFARRNQKITKRVHHKSMMKTALLAPVLAALLATASGVSYANSGISNGANNTIVAGEGAIAAGNGAIAIGENTKADQSNTIAVGNNNQALSQNTVMVGNANKEILYKDTAGIPVATNFDKRTFDSVIYGNRNTVDYNATVPPVNDHGTSGRTIVIGDDNMARDPNRSIVIGNENTSTDQFSVVIGNTAKATNTNSVVIGNGASNGGIEGVAIGSAATVKDGVSWSQAIGSGSLAEGRNSVSLGSQAKTHDEQTVGVGSHTDTYGAGSVALGAGAHTNWRGNTIEQSGYKVDGNLATALGYNAQALNKATATGAYSKADGTGSVANGFQARAYAQDGVALGHNSLVGENAKYGVAIGVGADVENEGSVALGSSSMDKKAVAVGESQVTDAQGKTVSYDNAQKDGALTIGVVSVGSETVSTAQVTQPKLTRQIVNVAPGEVSATSTDAINGKQLYNVMVKPITVTGNDDTVGGTKQILGSTLSISAADAGQTTGGATQGGTYLGKNLKTTISNGMVGISMTDSPDFKDVTAKSVTTGNTTMNDGGVTITSPAGASKNVSLTNAGLNNGGNKITNVADGTDDTDAVNYGQLKEVKGNAYKGWTVATGAAATDQQKVASDKTVTFKGTDFTNTANVNNGKKYGVESSLTRGENPTVTYDLTKDTKDAISKVDNSGIIYAGDHDTSTNPVKLGDTLTIAGDGSNITTTATKDNKVTLSLGDTITVGKPGTNGKDGQITVNGKDGKNGVTINGKDGSIGLTGGQGAAGHPGADGKDGQTIIKVIDGKPGTLGINGTVGVKGLDGKDGIDGITRIVYKDPQGTSQTVATLNDGLIFGANSGTDYAAKLNTKVSVKGADANTGADTFANKFDDGKNIMTNVEGDGTIRVALAKDITANSVTTGNTKVDNGGVTITNTTPGGSSVTLTGSGLNNGGNKITNVAPGNVSAGSTDAVNGGQLNEVKKEAGKHASVTAGKNVTVSTATNANGGTDYKVSVADKIALSDEGNVTIGDTTTLDKDGLKTGNTTVTTDGLTTGNTSVTTDGVTIKQSAADHNKSVTLTNSGLNNGGNQITNVASGMTDASGHATKLEDAVSTNGANIGDLQTLNTNLKNDIEAAKVTVKGQGHIKVTSKTEKASEYTVSAETANLTANNGKVSVAGTDGLTTAQNVADTINKSGWNIQGNGTGDTIVNPGHKVDFVDGDNTTVNVTTTGDKTTVKYDLNDATKEKLNAGITYAANKGQTDGIKLGETLNVKGDDKNIVTHGKDKDLTISLGKDIDLGPDSSLTTSTVNTHSITVTGQGNGNKVTINGSTGTVDGLKNTTTHYQGFGQNGRAATEEQLAETANELVDGVNNSLNNLGNRVNKVGAHAAALSGLHPLDFDPDEKWTFAAGYGHYKNANAAAIGAFYRPNEDTMFSVGGSMGGGENMVNAGVSFKVGQGNHVSTGRVAMAKEIKDLRAELEHVKDALGRVSEGEKLTAMDMDKMKLFPDVPKNHWAYDYVAVLAGNGIIDGFPNGKFEGDRMMTRYEMAALLYRAMQNGAKADERMARALKEFAPELERIRVDTISKHKDGTPDIQRVRVIPGRG